MVNSNSMWLVWESTEMCCFRKRSDQRLRLFAKKTRWRRTIKTSAGMLTWF